MEKRAHPLVTVTEVWDGDWDKYAPVIRVAMNDGSTQDYQLIRKQHPAFKAVIDLLDKLPIYGGYKAPGTKKRRWR